jgi:hypothetical protein
MVRHEVESRRSMTRKLAGIVLLLVMVASPQLAGGGELRYPVLDSKFPAAEAKLGWIDNEHVVFHGYEVGKFGQKRADGHELRETGIFIWDIFQNKITKYWDIDGQVGLCVFNGIVTFKQRAKPGQDIWNVVSGDLNGAQQRQEERKVWINGTSCRQHEQPPEWMNQDGHRRWALLEEHGYLDFGVTSRADPSKASPVLLYPPDQKNPKPLPFTGEQVRFHLTYFEFAGLYLLEGHRETTYATRIWLLKPDGTVTKVLEPTGKSWEKLGWGHYQLTKKGLLITGGRGDYGTVGSTGGYLLVDDSPVRIVAGFLRNAAVSPDGCKVAFVHELHSQAGADSFRALLAGKPGTRTLKMIDLCAGKGE